MIKQLLPNLFKLAISGAVIFGIAWLILTLEPSDHPDESFTVKESTADILSFSFSQRDRSQKFAASLENLGHEEPRAYDYNGNLVFFSTNVVRESRSKCSRSTSENSSNKTSTGEFTCSV